MYALVQRVTINLISLLYISASIEVCWKPRLWSNKVPHLSIWGVMATYLELAGVWVSPPSEGSWAGSWCVSRTHNDIVWISNGQFPPFFGQIAHFVTVGNVNGISTPLLYRILESSGLNQQILCNIWTICNQVEW